MTALLLPVGLVLAALAIDTGSLYTERRELQSLADLSAITAAANLTNAETAVVTTLKENGAGKVRVEQVGKKTGTPASDETIVSISRGRYASSLAVANMDRFVPDKTPYNAVRVTLKTAGTQYFGAALMAPPPISTQGVARVSSNAAFSVGSGLLKLDGGLANTIIGGLLGGNVSLSVMDYDALAKADVKLFDFLDALATKAKVKTGTYSNLLATQVTIGQVAAALADVPGLDQRSKLALQTLSMRANPHLVLVPGRVLNLGDAGYLSLGGRPAGLSIATNVMQLLTSSATIANGTNQIALNLGASIPGLLSATLDLAIGEPPQMSAWFTIGETGELVRTAQTRLLLTVEVGGPGGILGTSVKVPIYIELAYAEAKLKDISCLSRKPATAVVKIAAQPGVATLQIADVDKTALNRFNASPVTGPGTLVKIPLVVTATGSALVTVTNANPTELSFTRTDIDKGVIKTALTRNPAQTLTASLLQNLTLTVKLVGIDLGLSNVLKGTLSLTLGNAAPAIDQLLLGVLGTLGIGVGEADVKVYDASCARSALVQ